MDHEWNLEKVQCLLKHAFSGRLSGNDGNVRKLSNIHPNVCHFRWFEARWFWTSAELFQKPLVPPASLRASGPCEEAGFDKHLDDHAWTE